MESGSDIEFEAVQAGRLLGKMQDAGSKLNIVILDACRDNPFRSFRSSSRGLAEMRAPKGSIIAYATSPGSVAEDGKGRNGVFTKHLLSNIRRPDLTVQDVFRETGLGVMSETGERQIPWTSSTPVRRFYFASSGAVVDAPAFATGATRVQGSLSIDSNVSGASVYVDGKRVGTTPLKESALSPGQHVVLVEAPGYQSYQKRLKVDPGRTVSMHVDLSVATPARGRIFVDTEPTDATIKILNIGPKFYQGMELDGGRYHVEVSAIGHDTKRQWIELSAGEDKTLTIRLESVSAKVVKAAKGTWRDPTTGMEFVWVAGGCFQMGQTDAEKRYLIKDAGEDTYNKYYKDDLPRHEVCVDGFWMGKNEVTNVQFRRFRSTHNSKDYKGRSLNEDQQPAVYVSWKDAKAFADWLSKKGNSTFRLPTEAEWEYACRAGTRTARFWGDDPDDACRYANVHDKTSKRVNQFDWENHNCDDGYSGAAPVGRFQRNGFGLNDMLGNVWEWCEDIYAEDAYNKHFRNNPIYTQGGPNRVIRGGSWHGVPGFVRCAFRYRSGPGNRGNDLGFRLLRTK